MPRRSDCSVSDSRIRQGTPCVDYLVKHLPYIILHHPCFEADLESALVHSFTDMDEKLRTAIGDESGSCAVVALLRARWPPVCSQPRRLSRTALRTPSDAAPAGAKRTRYYRDGVSLALGRDTAGMTASTRKGTTYSVVSTRCCLTLIRPQGSA